MFLNVAASKAVSAAKVFLTAILSVGIVIFSAECSGGVVSGINFCLGVLVPSLFPFMAVSSFIVNSGIADIIGKPIGKATKALFGLSHCFAPAILLSLIGGYPVGARTISALYKNKLASKSECERAAMFAVCAGPGFLVNFVGVTLYSNKIIGVIMLCSQMISVVALGVILKFLSKGECDNNSENELYFKPMTFGNAVVHSALDSAKGMLAICVFVVLFSAFTGILNSLVPDSETKNLFLILIEVCSAVNELAAEKPIELIAFAIGFGGLSVHFQIYSSLKELNINKLSFFCMRIIQGAITALLTHLGLLLFCEKQQVFSTATVERADIFGGTIISGFALLGIAICFLYTFKKQN